MESMKAHVKVNAKRISGIRNRAVAVITALVVFISGMAGSIVPVRGAEIWADMAPEEGKYYLLISKATGKAMSVEGYSDGNSVGICQLDQAETGGYRSQVWRLNPVTKEGDAGVYYQIINYHSNRALNVPNNSENEGTQIIQWNTETGDNGIWSLTELTDGSYRISSRHKPDFSIKPKDEKRGAAVVQSTYGAEDNDGWELVEIAESDIKDNPGLETPDPEAAVDAFIEKFVYVDENGDTKLRKTGGFWATAETIEVLIDAYEHLGDEKYKTLIINLVDSFVKKEQSNWAWNKYNDDVMWATIMCSRVYLLTGEEKYLDIAKENFALTYDRA